MSTISTDRGSWTGMTLIDSDDHRLGTIEEIYFDEPTGRPLWMVVRTGLFGTRRNLVPMDDAMPTGDCITTPYDKSQIDGSPRIDLTEELADDRVRALYAHYGMPYDAPGVSESYDTARLSTVDRVLMYVPTD